VIRGVEFLSRNLEEKILAREFCLLVLTTSCSLTRRIN